MTQININYNNKYKKNKIMRITANSYIKSKMNQKLKK